MSLWDEFNAQNRVWTSERIEGMIRRVETLVNESDLERLHVEGDGAYGLRCAAYDKGDPEMILDCIQLESAVDSIEDQTVRAAVILCSYGFEEQDIGALLKGYRTGWQLVDEGIRLIRKHEQRKCTRPEDA